MNVLEALIDVIPVQLATTLKGVTPALATLASQAVGLLAQVSALSTTDSLFTSVLFLCVCFAIDANKHHLILILLSMSLGTEHFGQ